LYGARTVQGIESDDFFHPYGCIRTFNRSARERGAPCALRRGARLTTARSITPEEKSFVDTLARIALVLLILGQGAAGRTDSDIWGHMSIGLDMLRDRHFLWVDPYSFTHDQRWINHEWLWDIVVAAIYRVGGLPGLIALRALLVASVLWVVDRATRHAPGWVRIGALALVAVGCAGQWRSTRPQIATLALYALMLGHIDAWWLPLLFALWANTHGGWVFGLAALAFRGALRPSRRSLALFGASALATLLNPYGIQLWAAIVDAMSRGWADVSEWQPVWRLAAGADALVLWLAVAVAAAVAAWRYTRSDLWALGWTAASLIAAAGSRRLTALAAVTVAMLLAQKWTVSTPIVRMQWTRGRRRVAAAVIAAAGAAAFLMIQPSLRCFPPMPEWQLAPEPDAVAFLRTTSVKRLVPHFDFGEYAIFHLRDQLQVAIDNRRETVYSDAVVQENQRFTDGLDPGYPDRIGADAVWWPATQTRVIEELEQRGWARRFDGPRTVVLMKAAGPVVRGRESLGTPCFPNP
jgi:hypothetical protein